MLGCSRQKVIELIYAGELHAWRFWEYSGVWRIFRDSVAELMKLNERARQSGVPVFTGDRAAIGLWKIPFSGSLGKKISRRSGLCF